MRHCLDSVTVFNARVDPVRRTEVYAHTVLKDVGWHCESLSRIARDGLEAANRYTLRIPEDVFADGRTFAEPGAYRAAGGVSGLWTLQKGDVILRGVCRLDLDPTEVRERYGPELVLTVVGVTDNRGAAHGRHWKVTGA